MLDNRERRRLTLKQEDRLTEGNSIVSNINAKHYMHTHTHTHTQREREGEREREGQICN